MSDKMERLLRISWQLSAGVVSRRRLATIGAAVLAVACSESAAPPLAPSSLPGEKVQVFSLACPANVSRQSVSGLPVQVQYGSPVVQGGLDPVTTDCAPAAGSAFPVGRNRVECTGQDALQQTSSCSLFVTVLPTLRVTRILAFGDSLTAGTTSTPLPAVVQFDPNNSYPTKLEALLRARYSAQSVRVANFGLPGELAVPAISRFESALTIEQPDVVILMHGANDLTIGSTAGGDSAANAVETMTRAARARGVDAILATLPPQRANRETAAQVIPFNDRIRAAAASQGVPLVDVYQVINSGFCGNSPSVSLPGEIHSVHTSVPCIGDDNLHPTSQGYDLIANAMFNRIMAIYEAGGSGGAILFSQTEDPVGVPVLLDRASMLAGLR